ncbi:histone H1B, sperm [Biomphalaria glabrata]|nr:histone H1B; sperm-like [Biomphalaria glabrata]KAI8770626.1 histone H1B, sperm [Biomphalaria glabrata]
MGKKEANRSEDKEDVETDRQKGKEDQPTEEDICKAIKYLKDRKGSTITDIRKYLVAEVDKFKDATARKLDAHLKKAASKGVQNGRIAKTRGRFMLASSESGTESSKEQQKETSSKRNRRRRRGKCRVHKTNRRYCSRYKKRCCRRRRRCRASRHRSKRPVCSRYKTGCCRRRRR